MPTIRIYVPCTVLPVRVRLGYSDGLSQMEATLLRAVVKISLDRAEHPDKPEPVSLNELVEIFGLGQTITMHVIADLWRREHVTLDLRYSRVFPGPAIIRAHQDGRLDQMSSGEFSVEVIDVLQEAVTGQLLGLRGLTSPPEWARALPRDRLFCPTDDDISPSELLQAVQVALQQNAPEGGKDLEKRLATAGRGRRPIVLDSHLDRSRSQLPDSRWLPIEIGLHRDSDSGRLRVTVTDRTLSLARRTLAAERLSQYFEEAPQDSFVQHMNGQVGTAYDTAPTLDRNLERLTRLVAGARTAAPGTRMSQHGRLKAMATDIAEQLRQRRQSEVQVRVVGTGPSYVQVVRDLICRAEQQVILASPVVAAAALERLIDPLEDAVKRGVHLVVLWGSSREAVLESRAKRVLHHLREITERSGGNGGQVLFCSRPTRSGASLVVVDDAVALTGSFPVLAAEPRRGELGLLIEAPSSAPCTPIMQLLLWARRVMPDYALSRAILFRPEEFTKPERLAGQSQEQAIGGTPSGSWPLEPTEMDYPREPPDNDGPATSAAVHAWAGAWTDVLSELRRAAQSTGKVSAVVVQDAAHRDLFWDGLRQARSRVAIAGDRLTSQVVGNRLIEVLTLRLDEMVPIRLVHRRGSSYDPANDPHARLRGLAADRPPGLCLVDRAQNNSRAFVSDNLVVVGSFDFLGHEGYFSSTGHRLDAELGLCLVSRAIADEVCAAIGAVTVAEGEAPTPMRPPPITATTGRRGTVPAQLLLNSLEEVAASEPDRRAEVIRAAVEETGSALMDALLEAEAADDVLRVAAAWTLHGRLGDHGQDTTRWKAWLLRDAWNRGDLTGCWLLRQILDGATTSLDQVSAGRLPDHGLIEMTRALDHGDTARVLQRLVLGEDVTPERMEILVLVASAEAVTRNAQEPYTTDSTAALIDVLEYLAASSELPAPWRSLAGTVVAAGGALPFPLTALQEHKQLRRGERARQEAWAVLDESLAAADGKAFAFDAGTKTHAELFHEVGLFGSLRAMAAHRDVPAVRTWLADSQLKDLNKLIDRVSAKVTGGRAQIERKPRQSYLQRLTAIVQAARRLAQLPDSPIPTPLPLTDTYRVLANGLSALWPALAASVARQVGPERDISDRMMARLSPVAEWGREADE